MVLRLVSVVLRTSLMDLEGEILITGTPKDIAPPALTQIFTPGVFSALPKNFSLRTGVGHRTFGGL